MSLLSNTEKQMLDGLIPFNSDDVTELTLTRMRYTGGILTGMDWFINTNLEPIEHPFAEAMRDHEYLDGVRDLGRQLMINYKWSDRNILIMHRTGLNKYSKTDVNAPLDPVVGSNLELPLELALSSRHARDYKPREVAMTVEVASQAASVKVTLKGLDRPDGEFGYTAGQNPDPTDGVHTFAHYGVVPADGFYSFSEDVFPSDLIFANELNALNPMDPLNVPSLGIRVQTIGAGNQNTVPTYTFNIPFVKGTRRCLFVTGQPGGRLTAFSFYRLGEGDDLVIYKIGCALYLNSSQPSHANAYGFMTVSAFRGRASSSVMIHKHITVDEMHALSWNSLLVDTYYGMPTILDEKEELYGNIRVIVRDVEFNVGEVLGHLDKTQYFNYLKTGYGIFPPVTDERLKEVSDSWNQIPEAIVWRYAPAPVLGYSVKETSLYKEYGKRRAKACKTNDFLEQRYNQEYVYKQLENKLSNVRGLDVWCLDRALCAVTGLNTSKATGEVARSTVITKVNDLQFRAVSNDGLNKTLPLSEEGVDQFIDLFMPTAVTGDVAALELVIGSMKDLEGSTDAVDLSSYDMRLGSQKWPEGPHWPTLEATRTYDQRMVFLLSQLSDYSQFNVKLPQLLRSMMGDRVFPAMVKNYVTKQSSV